MREFEGFPIKTVIAPFVNENLHAFNVAFDMLCDNPGLCEDIGMSYRREKKRKRIFSLERMAEADEDDKIRLGKFLLRIYRRRTGVEKIDWSKFKAWIEEHWALIMALKTALTILFMFCI